ncbi:uncharacterized protein LOC131656983 [Vicia villosa]|uniref:uncharacterized protein LOC131656983 n=1 Tax=Vicia villosa TaxID=3911 RepID=UPI00273B0725|nr:uncharacterized protein LOC131656983 [Vicia villosa]
MQEVFMTGKDLPELAAVVVVRGKMEESADAQDFSIAKAAFSFLPEAEAISFTHKLPTYRALVDDTEFCRYVELYAKDEDAFFRVGVGVVVTAAVVILSYGDFFQRSNRASYCSSMAFR